MKEYNRFILVLLLVTLCTSLSMTLFNMLVDPYGILNSPEFSNINQKKVSRKTTNARLFKAVDVQKVKPLTILLGTSRTERGLDPSHPAFKKSGEQPVYNLALPAANEYEVRRYLEHAIANQPDLKRVVLGIDFFMFNQLHQGRPASFSEKRLEEKRMILPDLLDVVFSRKATQSSLTTIALNLYGSAFESYREDGAWVEPKGANVEQKFRSMLEADFKETYAEYQISVEAIEDFRYFIERCKKSGIEVDVFISPAHASEWEAIRASGLWPTFEEWKREIIKITPVWDFSGYNSVTTEPVTQDMQHYLDSSHYSPKTGNLVLNRILQYEEERVPSDFGVFVTPSIVEEHLGSIRIQREIWASQNSDTVEMVQEIKQKVNRAEFAE